MTRLRMQQPDIPKRIIQVRKHTHMFLVLISASSDDPWGTIRVLGCRNWLGDVVCPVSCASEASKYTIREAAAAVSGLLCASKVFDVVRVEGAECFGMRRTCGQVFIRIDAVPMTADV